MQDVKLAVRKDLQSLLEKAIKHIEKCKWRVFNENSQLVSIIKEQEREKVKKDEAIKHSTAQDLAKKIK